LRMRAETPPRPRGRGGAALRAAAGVAGAHGGWRRASPGAGDSKSQPAPRGCGCCPPFGMCRAAAASPAPAEARRARGTRCEFRFRRSAHENASVVFLVALLEILTKNE